jgi:hypothetical protein
MSTTRVCLAGLVVMLLGLGSARGQMTAPPPGAPPGGTAMPPPFPGAPAPQVAPQVGVGPGVGAPPYVDLNGNDPDQPVGSEADRRQPISQWLLYPRMPGCCGPIGLNGPIGYEIFARTGLAFPIGGGTLAHSLQNGWYVEGLGRVLFFNPPEDRAWAVTLAVGNLNAPSRHDVPSFTLTNVKVKTAVPAANSPQAALAGPQVQALIGQVAPGTPVTVVVPSLNASLAQYNQTWMSLYGGRVWYLWGSADCSRKTCNWRIGFDVGGRWATEKADFNEIPHLTGTAGGVSVAGYSDFEIPYQCAIFYAGIRTQYDYIWTDILQRQNSSNLQTFDLLFTVGVRF